mgnify:FL=1|tara:strand:+ start:600 stop:812 length:213 start_codon:yes stop_codon:yes gene_type:complete
MFNPEDFQLPLEKVLKLRVINDEVDGCSDLDVLKKSLKETSKLLMTYQHLLNTVLKEQLMMGIDSITKEE